jgi:uncharacterized protein YrrD
MEDLGPPVAYLALPDGVPVYDRDGTPVGTVEHVLADERSDIFHGLVVHVAYIRDRSLFAAPDQVAGLFERGATLTVSATDLHEPGEDAVAADAVDSSAGEQAREGLRRAWEWLSRPH